MTAPDKTGATGAVLSDQNRALVDRVLGVPFGFVDYGKVPYAADLNRLLDAARAEALAAPEAGGEGEEVTLAQAVAHLDWLATLPGAVPERLAVIKRALAAGKGDREAAAQAIRQKAAELQARHGSIWWDRTTPDELAAAALSASPGVRERDREAVARIVDPEAFAILDSHASYVAPETVPGHRQRQAAYAKADRVLALPGEAPGGSGELGAVASKTMLPGISQAVREPAGDLSEPYVPTLIRFNEPARLEYVTRDCPSVYRRIDDRLELILTMGTWEPIGFRLMTNEGDTPQRAGLDPAVVHSWVHNLIDEPSESGRLSLAREYQRQCVAVLSGNTPEEGSRHPESLDGEGREAGREAEAEAMPTALKSENHPTLEGRA
jgi:hypothetical protein